MQRLQVQLIVSLNRNTARRGALHSLRDRVRITEVILVALSKRLGISWRDLFDLVTKRNQLASHVVRGHAGFDPVLSEPELLQAMFVVGYYPSNTPPVGTRF